MRLVDVCALAIAAAIVLHCWPWQLWNALDGASSKEIFTVVAISTILFFGRIGMYQRSFATSSRDEVYAAIAAACLAAVPALFLVAVIPVLWPYATFTLEFIPVAAVTLAFGRFFAHYARITFFPPTARRIVVAGSAERVAAIPAELAISPADSVQRYAIEAFDQDIVDAMRNGGVEQLEWVRYAIDEGCREIIVTEALPPEIMPALLALTEANHIRLAIAPTRIRPHACEFSVGRDGGLALMYPRRLAICTKGADAFKRAFDVSVAAIALVVLAIPLAMIAAAVYFDSGAPIFYRQTRVGRNGKNFDIIKFRTMRTDAEAASGPVWARSGEDRTTRIGRILRRTSLDELPQLFNVLQGDMSIVGPRPERPFYVEQFKALFPRYNERHLVRPGITGWSHIHMRRNVDTSAIGERLSYDLFYLEHWSMFMDLLTICKTGAEFLFHSAA